MTTPTPKKATHKVMNPRGIDRKVQIFHSLHAGHDFIWYEGDDFSRPAWMTNSTVANLEAKGILRKVKNG